MNSDLPDLERSEAPRFDPRQASIFVEVLTGSAESPMTFQTFDDGAMKRGDLARILHGTLEEHQNELERLNAAGAGVFVTVNATDLGGRRTENVTALRALFADFDAGRANGYALEPNFEVLSARGPHAYWCLEPGAPLECFAAAQRQLAAFYDSDPAVHDLPRVMRLPGFFHCKKQPFLVTFSVGVLRRYSVDEVLAAHPVPRLSAGMPKPLPPHGPILPGAKIPHGRRREAWKTYAAHLHNLGTPFEQKVELMVAFGAAMFEQPETAREEDARGLAAWYDGKDQATNFTREIPAAPDVAVQTGPTEAEQERAAIAEEESVSEPGPVPFPRDWIRPGDGLAARPVPMARVSLASTLPSLHRMSRGGLPTGHTVCFVGPPDSAKTGTAQTVANEAERQGWAVVHFAPDNGREPAEIRYGQIMGFDRTKLEEGHREELARFRAEFAERRIYMPDPELVDDDFAPINTLSRVVEDTKRCLPRDRVVLLVDSIQVVVPDSREGRTPRERVIATMKILRSAASNPGWLVIATSQTNRDAYRNKSEAKNTEPLAAGAESAAIEFGSDLLVYMSANQQTGAIHANITKNKPGAGVKGAFPILWDRERALASEPDPAAFADEALAIARQQREDLWGLLEDIVTKAPGLSSSAVQLKAKKNRGEVLRALDGMVDADPPRLRVTRTKKGNFWFPAGLGQQMEIRS